MTMTVIPPAGQVVSILCTGGFESTYRLVELSRMPVSVQPIYCTNPERESTPMELAKLERLLEALRVREGTRAELLPLKAIPLSEIPADPSITAACRRLARDGLGSQYDFLARLAKQYPDIEVGIEKNICDKAAGFRAAIARHGALVEDASGAERLDMARSSEDLKLVMGNFRLPISHVTNADMLANLYDWGYEDILTEIWFCHEPLGGEPCGLCRACEQKMDSALEFLLSPAARRRYYTAKRHEAFLGPWLTRKLSRLTYRHLLRRRYE